MDTDTYIEELNINIKNNYTIRKSKEEKTDFRNFIISEMKKFNYIPNEVVYKDKSVNIETNIRDSKVIFTAHYDTPPVNFSFIIINLRKIFNKTLGINKFSNLCFLLLSFLLMISSNVFLILFSIDYLILLYGLFFMKNKNNMIDNTSGVVGLLTLAKKFNGNKDIGFIFFDNEEKGLKGSKRAAKRLYKEDFNMKDKIIINLDCICSKGKLDEWVISTNKENKNTLEIINEYINSLSKECKFIVKRRFSKSDYKSFKKNSSISISKCSKGIICGHYLKDIHSKNDTTLYQDDIKLLTNKLYIVTNKILCKERNLQYEKVSI